MYLSILQINLKIAKIKSGAEKTDIFDRFFQFFPAFSGKWV